MRRPAADGSSTVDAAQAVRPQQGTLQAISQQALVFLLQVAIYFPEQQQPRYGVVRAVIDDTPNEDSNVTAAQQVFLDSDSLVSDNVAPVTSSQPNRMADGNWHMVTVNTHADLTKGFMMYLDGLEVGNMLQGNETGTL